jgi:hypothetical protein
MKSWIRTFAPVLALTLGSCGTIAGNPGEDGDDKKKAIVNFGITDAPLDDAQSVTITVASLEVSVAGEGWVAVPMPQPVTIDLLGYQDGAAAALGTIPDLPVGTYQQTRLMLASDKPPTLVLADGSSETLEIPSGSETGLKIVTPFVVDGTRPVNLTIDFDLRKSVKRVGGNGPHSRYMMKPVLRLLDDDGTGTITGASATGKIACVYAAGSGKDASDDCDGAVNSAKVKSGRFKVAFLPAGSYEVRIFDADGKSTDAAAVSVAAGATVEATAE